MTSRRTRGFTLTEVLLSLALLSILVLGVFGWTTTSARTTTALVGPATWRASVEALRRAIQWDVFVADLREDRIKVDGNILRIRTRDQGVATHAYTIEAGAVVRQDELPDRPTARRILVEDVAAWKLSWSRDQRTIHLLVRGGPSHEEFVWSEKLR